MKVAPAELEALAAAALRRAGASDATAVDAARCLVAADMQGLGAHGISRVPTYCAHLRSGRELQALTA